MVVCPTCKLPSRIGYKTKEVKGETIKVQVPAGDKARIELGYRVALPGKNKIVGGNRRE